MTKPLNIQSYTIAHYGADYIGYALRSIFHFVEQAHVFYTPHPTHGHNTKTIPIETRDQIFQAAHKFDYTNKIKWYDQVGYTSEGPQRDHAVQVCKENGADIVIVIDCDEVWHPSVLTKALELIQTGNSRNWLINFTTLWRSFNWCCKDEMWPVRFIDLRQRPYRNSRDYIPKEFGDIFHFGYAVTDKVLRYKWQIHGHKNELRPHWFEDKWDQKKMPIKDCHPAGANTWDTVPFDKGLLPSFMKDHPFYGKEFIE